MTTSPDWRTQVDAVTAAIVKAQQRAGRQVSASSVVASWATALRLQHAAVLAGVQKAGRDPRAAHIAIRKINELQTVTDRVARAAPGEDLTPIRKALAESLFDLAQLIKGTTLGSTPVYDVKGRLLGLVDPKDVRPVVQPTRPPQKKLAGAARTAKGRG